MAGLRFDLWSVSFWARVVCTAPQRRRPDNHRQARLPRTEAGCPVAFHHFRLGWSSLSHQPLKLLEDFIAPPNPAAVLRDHPT